MTSWPRIHYEHIKSAEGVDRSINVTTSSQEALSANPSRRALIIANDTDADITLKFGATAVAGAGLNQKVMAPGDYWEIVFPCYSGRIDVIHASTGDKPLFIREF